MAKTQLEIVGSYGSGGWQDEHGTEYFNDTPIVSGTGKVIGKLLTEFVGDDVIILQTDELVLIKRGYPDDWSAPTTGVTVELNPFGFYLFELDAVNGKVRYRLLEDELVWKTDMFGEETKAQNELLAGWQLGVRTYSTWKPIKAAPPEYRDETTTKELKLVPRDQIPADAKGIQL